VVVVVVVCRARIRRDGAWSFPVPPLALMA